MFGVERQQEEQQQQPAAEWAWACASGVLKLVPPGGRTYQCGCVFACLLASLRRTYGGRQRAAVAVVVGDEVEVRGGRRGWR